MRLGRVGPERRGRQSGRQAQESQVGRRSPGRGAEPGKGSETESLVTCGPGQGRLSEPVSPQPQQHKMADTSPRTSRDSALAAPRPRSAPAPPLLSSLPAPPASHDVLPFRRLPPVFPGHAPARAPDVRREEGGAAAERRRLRVPGPELSPLALELSGVGIHSWIWASRHVTHRRVRPVQSPLAVQKALHRLGADFPHQNFSTGFRSAFSLLISHPREKRGRDTLKCKAVCLLVNGSGRTGNSF